MDFLMQAWFVWALLAAVFAAATAITAKAGMQGVDSDVGTVVRTVIVLALAAVVLCVRGKFTEIAQVNPRQGVLLALSGLATGASWLCYFRALSIGQAARVAVVDKLSVVLVAIFAFAFLGERLTVSGWCGVVLVAVGAYLAAR